MAGIAAAQAGAADDPVLRPCPPSIRDVARIAGVSTMTVSRVLNSHPSVRLSTRTRVLAAVDELSFRPNRAARTLSARRSQTIGVLTGGRPASRSGGLCRAVEDAARERGFYTVVARPAADSLNAIETAVEDLLRQKVEGIVIVAPRVAAIARLAPTSQRRPVVAATGDRRDIGGIPVAGVEQQLGAQMVVRYLIEHGDRRIVHVAGPEDWPEARSRLAAYKSELREAGLAVIRPLPGDWTAESGYMASRALIGGWQARRAGRARRHCGFLAPMTRWR